MIPQKIPAYRRPSFPTFFSTPDRLEHWTAQNCAHCRWTSQPADFLEPPRPCRFAESALSFFMSDTRVQSLSLNIIVQPRILHTITSTSHAPNRCAHFKDTRGRPPGH